MTGIQKEERFQEHLKRTENYFAAVRAADDVPWFEAGNPLRDERLAQLELAADISDVELRRAVFMRRYLP